jgi:hypothetical protein
MRGNVSDPCFVVRTINDGTMTMVCESTGSPRLLTYACFFNEVSRDISVGAHRCARGSTQFGMLTSALGERYYVRSVLCVNDFDGHHDRPRRLFEPCLLSHKQAYLGITIGNEFRYKAENQESGIEPGV